MLCGHGTGSRPFGRAGLLKRAGEHGKVGKLGKFACVAERDAETQDIACHWTLNKCPMASSREAGVPWTVMGSRICGHPCFVFCPVECVVVC